MICDDFRDIVMDHKLSFVYFGSKNCPSCDRVSKILNDMEFDGAVVFKSPKNCFIYESYSIEVIPTVIVFKRDRIYDILIGERPRNDYFSFLEEKDIDSLFFV